MNTSNIMPENQLSFIEGISSDLVTLLLDYDLGHSHVDVAQTIAALFDATGNSVDTLDKVNTELCWIISDKNR